MNNPIKQSSPVHVANKGSSSVQEGKFIPNGSLLAEILDALRKAQDNDLERQKDQAETEQKTDQVLGNCGGDPNQGIIALAAKSVIDAGEEAAKGLKDLGVSYAISAGISGAAAIATVGTGFYKSYNNSSETELNTLKEQREGLDDPNRAGDIILGKKGVPESEELVDPDGGIPMKDMSREQLGKVRLEPKELEEAKAKTDREIKTKEDEVGEFKRTIDRLWQSNQMIDQIGSSSTQAAGNMQKAGHDANAANANASAETTKTLQQMSTTAAGNFASYADKAAQQALKTADDLAQIAASQVQLRG